MLRVASAGVGDPCAKVLECSNRAELFAAAISIRPLYAESIWFNRRYVITSTVEGTLEYGVFAMISTHDQQEVLGVAPSHRSHRVGACVLQDVFAPGVLQRGQDFRCDQDARTRRRPVDPVRERA